ncbi:ribosome modulation factor [Paraburkholderia heleia]|uniref:ribosome modulation factor n=1 Tax=Paraburkholderia heleia TaxID=634127 RepID=UPI002AB7761D|nr:hypothetical protein [Paraburkholderia heleia]
MQRLINWLKMWLLPPPELSPSEQVAFDQGYEAARSHEPRSSNRYDPKSRFGRAWLRGYDKQRSDEDFVW